MTIAPEFSRKLPVDRVPAEGCRETIAAEPEECADLARRFGIPAVNWLKAELTLEPWRRGGVRVRGTGRAEIVQTCVITLEDFPSILSVEVDRLFMASPGRGGSRPAVISIDVADEDDPDVIEGGAIDLGEVVAETLALELDPYPRKPGARFDTPAGPAPEGTVETPFAALRTLPGGKGGKN